MNGTVIEPLARPVSPAEPIRLDEVSAVGDTALREAGRQRELATLIEAYHDATERLRQSHERLQQQVAALRSELADKNRELARRERLAALGEMAAGLAHEIRNPLGSIQLFASLLERDLATRPALQQTAAKISRGVHSMDRIVTDVLAFAGEAPPDHRWLRVADVLNEATEAVAAAAEEHETRLTVRTRPRDLTAWADADQMRQVAVNLLLNAIQSAGANGRVNLNAQPGKPGGSIRLAVTDNGPGIPPHLLDRVFNPFFTTRDTGTGLGLAIVHRIVEAHGGSIVAGNRREGGAVFRLTLPGHPVSTETQGLTEKVDE